MRSKARSFCVWFASGILPAPLFAFGFLSEYIDGSGNIRSSLGSVTSSDQIQAPKWDTSSPLGFVLCTAEDFATSPLRYQTSRTNEVLADIDEALDAWISVSGGSGSGLSATATTASADCSNTALNYIVFVDLGASGPIGFTSIEDYHFSGGQLYTTRGEIWLNSRYAMSTRDCHTAGSPSGSCTLNSTTFSLAGILTHELGHFIGIAHSMIHELDGGPIADRATMFPVVSGASDSIGAESLALDDQLARLNLYPGTGFPTASDGVISGKVKRSTDDAQRGAHILLIDPDTPKLLTGTFTSTSGTAGDNDGEFQIQGIPLDQRFIVVVEPVEQSTTGLDYNRFNTVVSYALVTEEEGYETFLIEGYPDLELANIREDAAADISDAQVFELTSGSRTASNINFYISQDLEAPNDVETATVLELVYEGAITGSNSLQVRLANEVVDLATFANAEFRLRATKDGQTYDWNTGAPAFSFSGEESEITIDISTLPTSSAGSYQVRATLIDDTYGTFSDLETIDFDIAPGSSLSGTSTSGGGCDLRARGKKRVPLIEILILLSAWLYLRRTWRKASSLDDSKAER